MTRVNPKRIFLRSTSDRMEDVQMEEDACRVRVGHAAENLATLRRLVLNLLRRDTTTKAGTRAKQLKAAWDHAYLQKLLTP
jgi:hypothetical protein